MVQRSTHPAPEGPAETPDEAVARLAWERVRIAEGDADIAAGRVIRGEDALEWLDRWVAGEDLEDPAIA